MSKLVKFEVIPFAAARVIGRMAVCCMNEGVYNPVPQMWKDMLADGSFDMLKSMPERATDEPDTVGWMGEYDPQTNSFNYIAGVLVKPDTPVPPGFVYRDIPACEMGVGWIQGSDSNGDVYSNAHNHTAEAMQANGYEYDYSKGGFELEYYSDSRFVKKRINGEDLLIMDYYSPCKKMSK